MRGKFHLYTQLDAMDCGPSCLRMIAKYYGKNYSLQSLRARSFISRNGVSRSGVRLCQRAGEERLSRSDGRRHVCGGNLFTRRTADQLRQVVARFARTERHCGYHPC